MEFDWKKLLPLIIAFVLVIMFAIRVFNALEPGDHRPTSIFPSDENTEYVEELFK